MKKIKLLLGLFFTMFKIGLFTFGGGYVMIGILEREFVEKKQLLEGNEFADLIGVAESTPGPIAINSATYIGYKTAGVLGSIVCTLGVVLPSFMIIFTISLFFDAFLELKLVQYAFKGIQACVPFLILSAGIRMFKKLKKTPFNLIFFIASSVCLITFTLFSVNFSTIFYVLIGGALGIFIYCLSNVRRVERKVKDSNKDKEGE